MTLPRAFRWLETNSLVLGSEDGAYACTRPFASTAHVFRCAPRAVEAVAESARNAQAACVAADGTLRLCDLCFSHRVRAAPRTVPVFTVRPSAAAGATTVVLRCHPGTPDAPPPRADAEDEAAEGDKDAGTATAAPPPLAVLTTAAYCPEPCNARLIAFGGTGSPVAFVGTIDYPLPYVT